MRAGGVGSTVIRATAWLMLAAAVVMGALALVGVATNSAPVDIVPEAWSPLGAVTGVLRVAFVAALGVAVSAAVPFLARLLGRRPTSARRSR